MAERSNFANGVLLLIGDLMPNMLKIRISMSRPDKFSYYCSRKRN